MKIQTAIRWISTIGLIYLSHKETGTFTAICFFLIFFAIERIASLLNKFVGEK